MKTGGEKVGNLLIDNGAEVNIKDSNGTLPIHWAAEHGILLEAFYSIQFYSRIYPGAILILIFTLFFK